jgi:peptidoglycan-associated lipoprotein
MLLLVVFMAAVLVGCSTPQANKPSDSNVVADNGKKQQDTTAADKDLDVVARALENAGDVYFAFDKYDIDAKGKATLKKIANILSKKNVNITVEGNCDQRGTKEYNLALGDKRANAAKQYLVSLGISSARISTVSYGKEKPVCAESTEACWAKNRRDHFVVPEVAN